MRESLKCATPCLQCRAAGKRSVGRAIFPGWPRHAAERTDDALALVAEALALLERRDERHWEAEIYHVKGDLLLKCGGSSEAETCFRRAIEIARRQSAKSLELRATTSLARLLDKQGRQDEARRMLADIYGWFTEGFDTADLKDAKALLDALS
jgi:tetratricopeptide (TPR) repeat protein